MNIINYISIIAIPFTIVYIIAYGCAEKIKVFDSFLVGAKEGIETVIKIFPTLIALFLAISALRNSGILEVLQNALSPFLNLLNIPAEVFPLMLIRPISGSASTAIALDIMKTSGVDSVIRTNCIYNYGIYRNYIIYNCHIYKCCKDKKNSFCFNYSTNC